MNERIKELAEQANGPNPFYGTLKNQMCLLGDDAVEKFAELIAAECAEIANKQFSAATGLDDRDCWTAAEIKKHFGVEE